jgi:hypothetical protein
MANISCDQKHSKLARTTQSIIKHILDINHEIAGLYAPMKSVFSSFTILSDFVAYEASIRVAIKDLTLAHFELVFPTSLVGEGEARSETTPPYPSWLGIPPISLLFNVFITQIPLPPERTSVKEDNRSKRGLTLKTPQRPQKANAEAARETAATLFGRIALLHREMATTVTSRLETASVAFLESEKQLLKRESLATSSESVVLNKTEFQEISKARIPASLEIPQTEAVQAAKPEIPIKTTERGEGIGAKIIESPQTTLLGWAATIQRELMASITQALEFGPLLLQTQKQSLRLASTASESRVSPLEKTRFEVIATSQIETPRDNYEIEATKIARPSIHERLSTQEDRVQIIEEQAAEARKETLLHWILSVRRQLIARISPQLKIESAAFLELQGKTIQELPVALGTNTTSLVDVHGDETQTRRISVPEENSAMATARIKATQELPWLIAYVKDLPTLMMETRKSFIIALYSSETSTSYSEPLFGLTTESQISQSQPAVPSPLAKKKSSSVYWLGSVVLPMLESLQALSAFPVAPLTIQRSSGETVIEKTSAIEIPSEIGVEVPPAKRTATSANLKTEERHIEAMRLPTFLTQLLGGYFRKSITTYPMFERQLLGETSLREEPSLGKMDKRQLSAEPAGAKEPMSRTFSLSDKTPKKRRERGPAAFIEELQQANAVYGQELSELAVSGPVRATMLSELTSGVLVPLISEPEIPAEPVIPEIITSDLSEKSPVSERLSRAFPEEETININVFEGTAEEDVRELESKIERILAEQVVESGARRTLGTLLPGEPSFGFDRTSTAELGTLDSQTISAARLTRSNAVEVDIRLNSLTEAADEDMKELERKIRRILNAQISRYYGSLNP